MRRTGGVMVAASLVAAVLALEAGWLGFGPGGTRPADALAPAATVLLAAFAALAAHRASRDASHPGGSWGWRLIAAAAGLWALGAALAVASGGSPPGPLERPDVLAAPVAAAGLLAFLPGRRRASCRARILLDAMILAAAGFFVVWSLFLGDRWDHAGHDRWQDVVLVLGTALAVVALTTALFVRSHGARVDRRALGLLVAALACSVLADGTVAYHHLGAEAGRGLGWWLAGAALGLTATAAMVAARSAPEKVADDAEPPTAGGWMLVAHTAVLVGIGVVIAQQLAAGFIEPPLFWTAAAAMALLLVRQVVSAQEVAGLTRGLETAVEERTAELQASERRSRSLMEHSSEVVVIVDPETLHVQYVSGSLRRIFGLDPAEAVAGPLTELVHEADRAQLLAITRDVASEPGAVAAVGFRVRHADGSWRDALSGVRNLVKDPAVRGLVLNVRDVTQQIRLEEQLKHQAFHDSLTGLPNRALFTDRVEHAIARAGRTASTVTVLYLDLDSFKHVNDSFGHEAGDRVLVAVGERLVGCMRAADTVARFGGDEFAVLLSDGLAANSGTAVAERVLDLFDVPFTIDGREILLGASLGIAETVTGLEDAGDLLRKADVAMYMAKSRGRSRFERFDPAMHADASERLALEAELRRALDRHQLFLEYQPIVDIGTGRVEGVEALVRWRHPERGVLAPSQFIPLAEETGLIAPLGSWVLVEACRQVRRWQRDLPDQESLGVSVNLSAWQVRQPEIVAQVAAVLAETRLDPGRLTLEITESVLLEDVDEVVDRLSDLKALGVNLAIDDFGTGYSSLSYLRKFPIDTLKIDQTFVRSVGDGPEESALARAIVKLGRTFKLKTVAEGIEDPRQAAILAKMGCDYGQGFHFSPPLEPSALREFLSGAAMASPTVTATPTAARR